MDQTLTSLDIFFLIKGLKNIEKSRIDKVFCGKEEITLSLYVAGQGKMYLNVNFPSVVFMSAKKHIQSEDTGLSKVLRKYLSNKRIISIDQYQFERIIVINTGQEKAVIELFDKGNFLLLKEDDTIISALRYKKYRERTIRGGIKYDFPKNRINPVDLSLNELAQIINGQKQQVVKTLARELSLGGTYAEELCIRAKIDKKKEKLPEKEIMRLHEQLNNMFMAKETPCLYGNKFSFLVLESNDKKCEKFDSLEELFEKILSIPKKEVTPPHLQKIEKIIEKQQESLKISIEEQEINNIKGSKIYEHYTEIGKLLEFIQKTKKEKGWDAVVEKLPPKVKINPKTGKLKIEMEIK